MLMSRRVRLSLYIAGGVFLSLAAVVALLIVRFQPIARDYFISTLRERYQSDIEMEALDISLFPTVRASGQNLIFRFNGRRDVPPMLQLPRFSVEARFIGFFRNPKHIHRLR